MASLSYSLVILSLFSLSAGVRHAPLPSPTVIEQACGATLFPGICTASLEGQLPPNANSSKIIQAAISVPAGKLSTAQKMVKDILDSTVGNPNRTNAAQNSIELLHYTAYRTKSTAQAMSGAESGAKEVKDARAWMSASLHYLYASWSALSFVNDTRDVIEAMTFINITMCQTSNALSMIRSFDLEGTDVYKWVKPQTERDGFFEDSAAGSGFKPGGVPSDLTADMTVCNDGSGDGECSYKTVQKAVDAAPEHASSMFVIYIKKGVYHETVRVPLEKTNLVFLGDGKGQTVITGNLTVRPGLSTYNTGTLTVLGDRFMMKNLTVANTAGPIVHQAVALRLDSDLSIIEDCEFLGNQDTLYAHTLRQYYRSCLIEGNVDFIFGNSASYFDNCTILIKPRQINPEVGENNAMTAQGRVDPVQSTGLVFHDCIVNGTKDYIELIKMNPRVHKNFLGRPWKAYSRTVFINCYLGPLISHKGWLPFKEDFALDTLYYGEFGNFGPGSNRSKRVSWSDEIPANHVNAYSVQAFIQGEDWIPASSP